MVGIGSDMRTGRSMVARPVPIRCQCASVQIRRHVHVFLSAHRLPRYQLVFQFSYFQHLLIYRCHFVFHIFFLRSTSHLKFFTIRCWCTSLHNTRYVYVFLYARSVLRYDLAFQSSQCQPLLIYRSRLILRVLLFQSV